MKNHHHSSKKGYHQKKVYGATTILTATIVNLVLIIKTFGAPTLEEGHCWQMCMQSQCVCLRVVCVCVCVYHCTAFAEVNLISA